MMPVECEKCGKAFSTQSNLNKHCRQKHNGNPTRTYADTRKKFNHQCLDCDCSFRRGYDFIRHLQIEHHQEIDEEKYIFETFEDFQFWKDEIERREKCNYIASTGKKKLSTGDEIQYFHCSRSGNRKDVLARLQPRINQKRKSKKKGSAKLAYSCTSRITLKEREGRFYASRIITHYGHGEDIQHLRLSHFDKQQLASKLANGVPKAKILEDIRSNVKTDLKRIDLITGRDLDNIKKSYNINQQSEHKNVSEVVWVKKNENEPDVDSNRNVNHYKKETILQELSDIQLLILSQDISHISDSNFQQVLSILHNVKDLLKLPSSTSKRE